MAPELAAMATQVVNESTSTMTMASLCGSSSIRPAAPHSHRTASSVWSKIPIRPAQFPVTSLQSNISCILKFVLCPAVAVELLPCDRGALILVVDDDTVETTAAVQALNASGYQTLARPEGLTGLIAVEEVHPALVVLDWGLPFLTGDTFLFALRTGLAMPPPVIAVLDASDDPAPPRASGARATLARPLDLAALVAAVHTILGGAAAA